MMSLRIFISYAKEDAGAAQDCFLRLTQWGFDPWIDTERILPGQNWTFEINKALNNADIVIILLSEKSVSKRGFVQFEANTAIEKLKFKKTDDIYIIPLVLNQCDVPPDVASRLQYIDLRNETAWEKIEASLRAAARQQSINIEFGQAFGPFRVFSEKHKEVWHGYPGYEIETIFPRFTSQKEVNISNELSGLFSGRARARIIDNREAPWSQDRSIFQNSDIMTRTSQYKDAFLISYTAECILSIEFDILWYGAGAAHHNYSFETFVFAVRERLYRLRLESFFSNFDCALKIISSECIATLKKEYWLRNKREPNAAALKWFEEGAGPKEENFSSFVVTSEGLNFLFPPYQVGPFSDGVWTADVSFHALRQVLKPHGLTPFGRE